MRVFKPQTQIFYVKNGRRRMPKFVSGFEPRSNHPDCAPPVIVMENGRMLDPSSLTAAPLRPAPRELSPSERKVDRILSYMSERPSFWV